MPQRKILQNMPMDATEITEDKKIKILVYFIGKGAIEIVREILLLYPKISKELLAALFVAEIQSCTNKRAYECIKMFVELGFDPNFCIPDECESNPYYVSLLTEAIQRNHFEAVEYLIKSGVRYSLQVNGDAMTIISQDYTDASGRIQCLYVLNPIWSHIDMAKLLLRECRPAGLQIRGDSCARLLSRMLDSQEYDAEFEPEAGHYDGSDLLSLDLLDSPGNWLRIKMCVNAFALYTKDAHVIINFVIEDGRVFPGDILQGIVEFLVPTSIAELLSRRHGWDTWPKLKQALKYYKAYFPAENQQLSLAFEQEDLAQNNHVEAHDSLSSIDAINEAVIKGIITNAEHYARSLFTFNSENSVKVLGGDYCGALIELLKKRIENYHYLFFSALEHVINPLEHPKPYYAATSYLPRAIHSAENLIHLLRDLFILSKLSSASESSDLRCVPTGFRDVPADGHCFYHAISAQLNNAISSQGIHQLAIQYLVEHPNIIAEFLPGLSDIPGETPSAATGDDAEAQNAYLDKHLGTSTWADNLIIQVVSAALNVAIQIHMFNADGTPQLNPDGQQVVIAINPPGGSIPTMTVVVGYVGGVHYIAAAPAQEETVQNELGHTSPDQVEPPSEDLPMAPGGEQFGNYSSTHTQLEMPGADDSLIGNVYI